MIFYDESRNNFMLAILWIMARESELRARARDSFPRISSDILHNIGDRAGKKRFFPSEASALENLLKRHSPASERYFCLGLRSAPHNSRSNKISWRKGLR